MSHPDIRRIHALRDGRLGASARGAFESHLRECRACADEYAAIERLQTVARRVVSTAELPYVDWDRVESRLLNRLAAAGTSPSRASFWRVLIPAAIAAGLVVAVMSASRTPTQAVRTAPAVVAREAPDALRLGGQVVSGVVTLVRGDARWAPHTGDPFHQVTISSPVREGSNLVTSGDARLVVQTAEKTGFQLAAGTSVQVLALRDTGAVLRLESGAIASRVQKLHAGEVYRVVAGELLIEVRGTRFDVRRDGSATVVSVTEGVVAVRDLSRRAEGEVLLTAPAEARFEEHQPLASGVRAAPPVLPALWTDIARGPFAVLRLPPLPGVSRIEVDGIDVGSGDSILRHVRGTAEVVVYPLEGGPIRTEVPLDGSTMVTFRMPEARPNEAASTRPAVGRLDRDAISRAMGGYSTQVRRCYDRRLKRVPTLRDRLELRITIGTDGAVSNATLGGGEHDAEVAECVLMVARRWTFQAPQGGPVTVSVPFNFAPRGLLPDAGP